MSETELPEIPQPDNVHPVTGEIVDLPKDDFDDPHAEEVK